MNISKEIKKALAEAVIARVKKNEVSVNFLESILQKNELPVTVGKVSIYKGGIATLQGFSVSTLLRVLNLLGLKFQPRDPILVEDSAKKWGILLIPSSGSKLEKELEKLEKELRQKALTTSSRQLCRLFDDVQEFEFDSGRLSIFVKNPEEEVPPAIEVVTADEVEVEKGEEADDEIETMLYHLKVAVHLSRELSPNEGLILNTSPASGVWKGESEDSFFVFNGGLNPEEVLTKGFIEEAVELLYCALMEVESSALIKERIEKISFDSWKKIMLQS